MPTCSSCLFAQRAPDSSYQPYDEVCLGVSSCDKSGNQGPERGLLKATELLSCQDKIGSWAVVSLSLAHTEHLQEGQVSVPVCDLARLGQGAAEHWKEGCRR